MKSICHNIGKPEDKYKKINSYLLNNDEQANEINSILKDRNNLAHAWVDEYLDYEDTNFIEKAKNVVFLDEILEKYVKFVKKPSLIKLIR